MADGQGHVRFDAGELITALDAAQYMITGVDKGSVEHAVIAIFGTASPKPVDFIRTRRADCGTWVMRPSPKMLLFIRALTLLFVGPKNMITQLPPFGTPKIKESS